MTSTPTINTSIPPIVTSSFPSPSSSSPASSTLLSPQRISLRSTSSLSRDRYSQVTERAAEEEKSKAREEERRVREDRERREREEREGRERKERGEREEKDRRDRDHNKDRGDRGERDRDREKDRERGGGRGEREWDRDRERRADRRDAGRGERKDRPDRDERRERPERGGGDRGERAERDGWPDRDRDRGSRRGTHSNHAAQPAAPVAAASHMLRITPSSLAAASSVPVPVSNSFASLPSSSPPSSAASSSSLPPPPPLSLSPHPLPHPWVLYFDHRSGNAKPSASSASYESSLLPVATVSSAESWWSYFNHLLLPSQLDGNSNYHLFRKGVRPVWEDRGNEKGGKWVIKWTGGGGGGKGGAEAAAAGGRERVDVYWLRVVLGVIGESMGEGGDDVEEAGGGGGGAEGEDGAAAAAVGVSADINGVVVSRRRNGDRLAVWNRSREEGKIRKLGESLRRLVIGDGGAAAGAGISLSYDLHEDSLKAGSSYANAARYTM